MATIPNTRGNPQASDVAVQTALPMIGSASREDLQATLALVDAEMAKLYEDRNLLLADGGLINFVAAGTSVTFSQALKLHLNSTIAGSPVVIDLGSTTRAFSANNRMLYAVIDRIAGTATVTADGTSLPAVTSANKEVVLIAKRVDSADGSKRLYFRDGTCLYAGQAKKLGTHEFVQSTSSTDSSTTGANATMAAFSTGIVRLTDSSLSSISGIPAGFPGQTLILENKTTVSININNDDAGASAADRIFTGSGGPVSMPDNSTFMFTYDDTSSRWMLTGGSGSGSGSGGINYIKFGDAEAGTQGWATYADAAGINPVNGIGGSPTLTLTATATNPLRGLKSYLLTKDAADRQGEGASYDFSIDSADQLKILTISFDKAVDSGTYLNGDLGVFIYDVTNSVLIEPLNINVGDGSFSDRHTATFQTSYNSTSYRLIFHVRTTSTSAWVMKIDNIVVGPSTVAANNKEIVTSVFMITPGQSLTANVTDMYFDSVVKDTTGSWNGYQYVVPESGDYLVSGNIGVYTATETTPSVYINGVSYAYNYWDTVLNGKQTNGATLVTNCKVGDLLSIRVDAASSVSNGTISFIKVPSGNAMSSGAGGRTVAFYSVGAPTGTVGSGPTFNKAYYPAATTDNCGGFDQPNGRYRIPYSGYYNIEASFTIIGSPNTTADYCGISIRKNGGDIASEFHRASMAGGNGTSTNHTNVNGIFCNAGDYIEVFGTSVYGGSVVWSQGLSGAESTFSIVSASSSTGEASNPNPNVAMAYGLSFNQSLPNTTSTVVLFDVKEFDTTNSYNPGTGIYTVPISGKYQININMAFPQNSGYYQPNIRLNGSDIKTSILAADVSYTQTMSLLAILDLKAGDQVSGAAYQASAGAQTLAGSTIYTFMNIHRIGA